MLRSDRLRTPDADDHDESELWELLRSEAHERHSVVDAVPPQASSGEDFRAAFDSELPEDLIEDFMSSTEDTGRHSMQPPAPPRESYVRAPAAVEARGPSAREQGEESEAARLALYEAQHAQLGDPDYDDDELDQALLPDDEQDEYVRQELAMEQLVSEQYDLQRFSQPPPFPPTVHYGEVRASRPDGSYSPRISSLPPAAYGHVAGTRNRARWIVPIAALTAVLAFGGAAGYQFVLLPRREAARSAELAQQKAAAIAREEQAQAEAAARAEAEQAAANEAAVRRADEAAAAAAGEPLAPAFAKRSSSSSSELRAESSSERRRRERHERHERRAAARAAARAAKHEERAARHAARDARHAARDASKSEERPSHHREHKTSEERSSRRKKQRAASVDASDDPLFGL